VRPLRCCASRGSLLPRQPATTQSATGAQSLCRGSVRTCAPRHALGSPLRWCQIIHHAIQALLQATRPTFMARSRLSVCRRAVSRFLSCPSVGSVAFHVLHRAPGLGRVRVNAAARQIFGRTEHLASLRSGLCPLARPQPRALGGQLPIEPPRAWANGGVRSCIQ